MRRWVAGSLVGIGLLLGTIMWWLPRVVDAYGAHLVSTAPPAITVATKEPIQSAGALAWQVAPASSPPPGGHVIGSLAIPALQLKTAFVEGTSYGDLLLAPGHFSGSVLPGQLGTSVIAAHNATYFRHLNTLHTGNEVVVTTAQGTFWFQVVGHGVVSDVSGLANDYARPRLDLEACYPLDALYFTPDRYVVYTVLVRDQLRTSPITATVSPSISYAAQILPAIARTYPLPLKDNSVPMGTMHYMAPNTSSTLAFKQSGNSLQVEAQAIDLWDAARYTSQYRDTQWYASLFAHGVSPTLTNAFSGARTIVYEAPLNIILSLNGSGNPTALRLQDDLVRVNGMAYSVTMVCQVMGNKVAVQSFQVTPS